VAPSQPFQSVALHRDRFCFVGVESNAVNELATKILEVPFELNRLSINNMERESFAAVIRQLTGQKNGKKKAVGVVIHSDLTLVKAVPVGLGLDEKAVRSQLTWEADQQLIAPLSEYVLEFERLPVPAANGNPLYIIVMVRKKIIQLIRTLIDQAGLHMKYLDVDIFSTIRSLTTNYPMQKDNNAVLIDIQKQAVKFILLRHNDFYLVHRMTYKSHAGDHPDIPDLVDKIVKELKRLVFGHNLAQDVNDINRIMMIGEDLVISIQQELKSRLSVPVELLNPFRNIKMNNRMAKSKEMTEHPERYSASIGMILKYVPALAQA